MDAKQYAGCWIWDIRRESFRERQEWSLWARFA
jgi:hypothetical protein